MKTSTIVWVVVIVVIIVGGWYLWMHSSTPAPIQQTSSTTTSTTTGDGSPIGDNLILGTDASSTLGLYLIGYNGMTLYTTSADSHATSTCYGTCAQTWLPYTVPAGTPLNLEAGVTGTAALLQRTDGTYQVTYNGMPLYFYTGDTASEQMNGQGMGGTWYVAKP